MPPTSATSRYSFRATAPRCDCMPHLPRLRCFSTTLQLGVGPVKPAEVLAAAPSRPMFPPAQRAAAGPARRVITFVVMLLLADATAAVAGRSSGGVIESKP